MKDWRPYFPLTAPRPEQVRALDDLCTAVENGKRILVADLGTGVGKSAIAVTLSRWLAANEVPKEPFVKGAVVLTSQKLLQDQYVDDFPEARDLRSAQNFQCTGPMGGTCGETWRVRKAVGVAHAEALKCPDCPYRKAKEEFKSSEVGVTNYSYYLSEAVYAGELPLRQLLVLDEAHNVEDEVRRWSTIEITEDEANEHDTNIPWNAPADKAQIWLQMNFKGTLERKLGNLSGKLQKIIGAGRFLDEIIPKLAEMNDRYDKRKCQINRLAQFAGEVLVSYHETKKGMRVVKFQPVDVGELANELLYSRTNYSLLMSATILDVRIFSKATGIRGAHFVRIPTPFKPEAFGVTIMPVGKMTRTDIETSLKRLPGAIRRILKDNPSSKGVIHTVSYKIAQAVAEVDDPRLLIQRKPEDRERMLEKHLTSKEPTVLVSPAMMEGLDLKDDLARFQVICKMPYPDMSDPITKRKDWDWYAWRTARAMVQAAGRSVRSTTDWTKTYILDLAFLDMLDRNGHLIPEHLKSKIEVEDL